jgi:hypothetical protein
VDAPVSAAPLTTFAVIVEPFTVTAEELPTTEVSNITVTTARACSAAVTSPLLTVDVQGGGRVTDDSAEPLRAGIDCPGDCTQRHASGVSVPLLAVPSAGQRFDGWAGDCAAFGNAPRILVPLTRDATCSARFVAADTGAGGGSVALAVTVVEPTSTSGIATGNRVVSEAASIDCTAPRMGACSARIASDAEVSLRALPGVGQRFVSWEGCDRVPQTPGDLCFVLGSSGDRAVRANFEPVPVANIAVVVTEPVGSTGNRVISFPAGIDCSSSDRAACSARFLGSTVDVALTAMPEPGQRFVGWSGCNAVSTAASPQCFVQPGAGNRTVTAQFEAEPDSVELRVSFTGRSQLDDDGSAATDAVLSNLVGIRCVADGSGCVARFPQGMEVRLTLQLDPTLSASGRRSRLLGWTECDALEAVDIDIPPVCVLRMLNQDTEVSVQVGHVFDEAFTGNAPIARVAVTGARGALRPNAVDVEAMFDARGSSVEAGRRVIAYEWDWDANGVYDCAQTELDTGTCFTTGILSFGVASHQYTRRGATTARVRVIDDVGRARVVEQTFTVE